MRRIRLAAVFLAGVLLLCTSLASASAMASTTQVAAWGSGDLGQLGNESSSNSNRPEPVVTGHQTPLSEVASVAGGADHGLAVTDAGTVYAWGDNKYGQLGVGTEKGPDECSKVACSTRAVKVNELTSVSAVAAGDAHSLALKEEHVLAWGDNEDGQLGDESTTNSDTPIEVPGLGHVAAIAAGCDFSLALENGHVYAWGAGGAGQLGDESTTSSDTRVEVKGITEAVAIAAGCEFGMALLKKGEIVTWGANAYGQLGDGTTTSSDTPVPVSGIAHATAIAGGHEFALALEGGHVKSWGANNAGQLGDGSITGPETCGTTACATTPVTVTLPGTCREPTAIAAGGRRGGALKGGYVCFWGTNGTPKKNSGKASKYAKITNADALALGGSFTLVIGPPVPVLEAITPRSGTSEGGTTVTIKGFNFIGGVRVYLSGTPVSEPKVTGTTEITFVTAPGAPGKDGVKVCTEGGCNSNLSFIYLTPGLSPVFGRCLASGGEYNNSACTELGGAHAYAWQSGVSTTFTLTGTSATFVSAAGTEITCEDPSKTVDELSGSGEIVGEVDMTLGLHFTNCNLAGSSPVTCTTEGAAEGELVTSTLEGYIGFESKELSKVGVAFSPQEEGEPVLEATCGEDEVVITGAVIAGVAPVNEMKSTFRLNFRAKKGGKQNPEQLEKGGKEVLYTSINEGTNSQTSLAIEETTLTPGESFELNTFV